MEFICYYFLNSGTYKIQFKEILKEQTKQSRPKTAKQRD